MVFDIQLTSLSLEFFAKTPGFDFVSSFFVLFRLRLWLVVIACFQPSVFLTSDKDVVDAYTN